MAINHNANEFGTHENLTRNLDTNGLNLDTINLTAARAQENFNNALDTVLKSKHSGLSPEKLKETSDFKHAEQLKKDVAVKIESLRKQAIQQFANKIDTPNDGSVKATLGKKVNVYTALFAFASLTPSTLKIALDVRNPEGTEKLNVIKNVVNERGDGKHNIDSQEGRTAAINQIMTDLLNDDNLTYKRKIPQRT